MLINTHHSKVSWGYNWFSQPGGTIASGVNYFPMLWSAAPEHSNQWEANANAAIAAGSTHLLLYVLSLPPAAAHDAHLTETL